MGLSFPGSTGGEIEVSSFSFDGSKSGPGAAAPGPLTLTLPGSAADPTFLANMAAGYHLTTAQLNVRTSGAAPAVYLTYKLGDVTVGSIRTSVDRAAAPDGAPVTTITLDWAKLSQSYAPVRPDGSVGTPVVATWDAALGTGTGAGIPAGPSLGSPPVLGLSFGSGELAATTFDFSGARGDFGSATPGPLTVTLPGSTADPTLLADMIAGTVLSTAQVRVRALTSTGAPYLTYTLGDVVIDAIRTTIDASAGEDAQPVTTITLDWGRLTQSYTPAGSSRPVVTTWDATHDTVTGVGTPATPAGTPMVGLSFGAAGELPVTSFHVSGSLPRAGSATPGPITITLPGSVADPTLLADMVAGHTLSTAQVNVRRTVGATAKLVVYQSYSLSSVAIDSIQTSVSDIGDVVTTITLEWSTLTQSYTTIRPDGTADSPVVATWYATLGIATGTGTPATSAGSPTSLGLSFGGTGEVAASSFDFSGSNDGLISATPGSFTVTLPSSAADPTLLANLGAGYHLGAAQVRVRSTGAAPALYLTYTLSDVRVTSIRTSIDEDGSSVTTLDLGWARLTQSYAPVRADGSLGKPVVATWDAVSGTGTGAGNPVGTAQGVPDIGLSFNNIAEIDASSFDVSGFNSGTGVSTATAGPIAITLRGSTADPTLLADMIAGTRLSTAQVRVRTIGATQTTYLTYTLDDVIIDSIQTTIDTSEDFDTRPVTTIMLSWAKLTQSYTAAGSSKPVVATWDAVNGTVGGAGTPATPAGTPTVGLSFGAAGELPVSAFEFAGSNPGSGGATPGPLTITLSGSAAEPTLLADMAAGTKLPTAQIRVRTTGAKPVLYLTYSLTNITVGSIRTTIDDRGDYVTTITLNWATVTESYAPIQPSSGLPGAAVYGSWNAVIDTATGTGTPATSNPTDVTSQFQVTQDGFRYNRATGQFVQTITIAYLGSAPFVGPLSLSLDGLIGGSLVGASTSTGALKVRNGLFIDLPTIGVGKSLTITLTFDDPYQASIFYIPHLLKG